MHKVSKDESGDKMMVLRFWKFGMRNARCCGHVAERIDSYSMLCRL